PTATPGQTPAAPTALKATNETASSFTANWTSVTGATGYRLDVSTNSSFTSYVPPYQNFDVGNTTSYNVTGLGANTFYYYRFQGYLFLIDEKVPRSGKHLSKLLFVHLFH